ncbi:MAG: IgaA/UmoB family intracellular growth attenuator, partial [Solirubrobacteraceae bacterium]|nr:IgaA/UmoB family intracellular growth attenuator [Solirubrobacteraceae bacterium]
FIAGSAVVIALDNGFDLAGARERDWQRQAREQQWQGGASGALGAGVGSAAAPADLAEVTMLGQRDETPAEVAMRASPGLGLVAGLLLAAMFTGLAIASTQHGPTQTTWASVAAACGAIALAFILIRRSPGAPGKVNRVRGQLHSIALPIPGRVEQTRPALFLGDQLALTVPDHWKTLVPAVSNGAVELEMRVDDNRVLRYDNRLSLDAEVRLAPPVFRGRHLTLASVGLIAVLALLIFGPSPTRDLRLAWAWASGGAEPHFTDPARLIAAAPATGTWLRLRGEARCEPAADGSLQGCVDLRWGGSAPKAKPPEIDVATLALQDGRFVALSRDDPALMLARLQLMALGLDRARSPHSAGYVRAVADAPTTLDQPDRLVKDVQATCPVDPAAAPD